VKFELLSGSQAVCRLPASSAPPAWWDGGVFCSLTRTQDELSVVCAEAAVPSGVRCEGGWRVLKLVGPFEFDAVGILAPIATRLASAGISMLPVGTFDTDYLLIKQERVAAALELLREQGHSVESGR